MYFDIERSTALLDPITKSRYNLDHAALVVNVITSLAGKGIPPKDQGVVTPYLAQVLIYRFAANQLHLNKLLVGWD